MSDKIITRFFHPPISQDEATELLAHHLELAAMYFEATPFEADFATVAEEVYGYLANREKGQVADNAAQVGGLAFINTLRKHYKDSE